MGRACGGFPWRKGGLLQIKSFQAVVQRKHIIVNCETGVAVGRRLGRWGVNE